MQSRRLILIGGVAALLLLVTVIFVGRRARAAQVESSSSTVPQAESKEIGAPPDATYGEAMETPNHRRRRLAAAADAASAGLATPSEYPIADALRSVENATADPPHISDPAPSPKSNHKKSAPKRVLPHAGVADSATAQDALKVSDRWQKTTDAPTEGKDGRVVFDYGAGLATVVCAPLRLCIVELQRGEKLASQPQIGDSVRWNVEPASYGTGEQVTPLIVLKPKAVDLDTNLVITTDRRLYLLRLMSSSHDYMGTVSFEYHDDEQILWQAAMSKQAEAAREATFEKEERIGGNSIEDLNVDYRLTGDKRIRPIRVLDNGVHTYIQMNPAILYREAPILAVIGPEGKAEIVNYRVKGSVYIVDRLFERARLILGSGRKAQKADIISGAVKVHRLFARDPFRSLTNKEESKQEQAQ